MAPGAAKDDLLYVADNFDVTVYSYPRGKLVGVLRHHFYIPATECTDKAGDVFITDGDNVFVYAHAATKPLRTLTYSGYLATGCSSDPATGDLAVAYSLGLSKAYLAIFKKARGTPTLYQAGDLIFSRCGYDPTGNLYADGNYGSGSSVGFVKLPKGGDELKTLSLNQSFQGAGDVQWDGKYMTFGDNSYPTDNIYRFAISGSTGTLVGTTSLNAPTPLTNWWIEGTRVIAGTGDATHSPTISYWAYPTGGDSVKEITKHVPHYPNGVTVSKAKR